MQMDDDVLHLGVVHRLLGVRPPSVLGRGEIGIDPDKIERIQIDEIKALGIANAAAHYKVKFVHMWSFPGKERDRLLAARRNETQDLLPYSRSKFSGLSHQLGALVTGGSSEFSSPALCQNRIALQSIASFPAQLLGRVAGALAKVKTDLARRYGCCSSALCEPPAGSARK